MDDKYVWVCSSDCNERSHIYPYKNTDAHTHSDANPYPDTSANDDAISYPNADATTGEYDSTDEHSTIDYSTNTDKNPDYCGSVWQKLCHR